MAIAILFLSASMAGAGLCTDDECKRRIAEGLSIQRAEIMRAVAAMNREQDKGAWLEMASAVVLAIGGSMGARTAAKRYGK